MPCDNCSDSMNNGGVHRDSQDRRIPIVSESLPLIGSNGPRFIQVSRPSPLPATTLVFSVASSFNRFGPRGDVTRLSLAIPFADFGARPLSDLTSRIDHGCLNTYSPTIGFLFQDKPVAPQIDNVVGTECEKKITLTYFLDAKGSESIDPDCTKVPWAPGRSPRDLFSFLFDQMNKGVFKRKKECKCDPPRRNDRHCRFSIEVKMVEREPAPGLPFYRLRYYCNREKFQEYLKTVPKKSFPAGLDSATLSQAAGVTFGGGVYSGRNDRAELQRSEGTIVPISYGVNNDPNVQVTAIAAILLHEIGWGLGLDRPGGGISADAPHFDSILKGLSTQEICDIGWNVCDPIACCGVPGGQYYAPVPPTPTTGGMTPPSGGGSAPGGTTGDPGGSGARPLPRTNPTHSRPFRQE